jgi:hypothetical protein
MTKISDRVVQKIRRDKRIIGRMIIVYGKSYQTIINWMDTRSPMLTTPDAVKIISEETGLSENEILDEPEIAA